MRKAGLESAALQFNFEKIFTEVIFEPRWKSLDDYVKE
jgi:hypothetical protein